MKPLLCAAPLLVKLVNTLKPLLLKKQPQPRDILEVDLPQVPSLWDAPYKKLVVGDKVKLHKEIEKGLRIEDETGKELQMNDKTAKLLTIEDNEVEVEFKDASGHKEIKWISEQDAAYLFSPPPPSARRESLALSEQEPVGQGLGAWLKKMLPADDEEPRSTPAQGGPPKTKKADDEPVRVAPRRQSIIQQGRFSLDDEDLSADLSADLDQVEPSEGGKKGCFRFILGCIAKIICGIWFAAKFCCCNLCGLFCTALKECLICAPIMCGNCICRTFCFCFYKRMDRSKKKDKEVELVEVTAEKPTKSDLSSELTILDSPEVATFDVEAGDEEEDDDEEDLEAQAAVGRFSTSMPSL